MPMMISPFDQQIVSGSGHSPIFEANVPVWVADSTGLAEECMERGVKLYTGEPPTPAPEVVAPAKVDDNERDEEAEFAVGLDQALMRILTREDPNDLNAQDWPKVTKVTAEMSPDLRRPTATEISVAYEKLQENIDLAE